MPKNANSEIDVCATALVLLGLAPIQSFDEESEKAAVCERLYAMTVEALLRGYPWRFAMNKGKLSRLTAKPINEWTYGYQLPDDRAGGPRAVFSTDAIGAVPTTDFEIFGDKLFANAPSIWIDYPFSPEVKDWPPHFIQLVVYALAAHLADALTDEQAKSERWYNVAFGTPVEGGAGGYFRTAKSLDANIDPPEVIQSFELVNVRM